VTTKRTASLPLTDNTLVNKGGGKVGKLPEGTLLYNQYSIFAL